MLFNSTEFFLFFPVVVAVYFALPARLRWPFLLAASYYFYMAWQPSYVVLIFISTLVCYAAGLFMGAKPNRPDRLPYLLFALVANLGLLFFFKYYNFFADTLRPVVPVALPASRFLLPLGISFFTFQSLSYVIEVYRGKWEAERHLGRFALYVAFFPQLVAGPIERPGNLLPQFREDHHFDYDRVTNGMKLMAWGLFKKMVIADRLAMLVDHVYADPTQYDGLPLTLATVCFAFQIFCDFSGYSDIAIGAAGVLGFRLMDNFRRPYSATSVAEFWRRWHISLSTWFRDYVYIPLGGNRVALRRWHVNILIVFLLSGLWHGANWTFALWGLVHALYLVAGRALAPFRERLAIRTGLARLPRLHHALQVVATFALVCFACVFFRANTLSDALHLVTHLPRGWGVALDPERLATLVFSLGLTRAELLFVAAMVVLMELGHAAQSRGSVLAWLGRRPLWLRWAAYSALVWGVLLFGVFKHKEFIYFTF